MAETIETTWGKVGQILGKKGRRSASRRVKIIIEHTPDEDVVKIQDVIPQPVAQLPRQAEQLEKLHQWMSNHSGVPHRIDDSRDSIYQDVIRDTH